MSISNVDDVELNIQHACNKTDAGAERAMFINVQFHFCFLSLGWAGRACCCALNSVTAFNFALPHNVLGLNNVDRVSIWIRLNLIIG